MINSLNDCFPGSLWAYNTERSVCWILCFFCSLGNNSSLLFHFSSWQLQNIISLFTCTYSWDVVLLTDYWYSVPLIRVDSRLSYTWGFWLLSLSLNTFVWLLLFNINAKSLIARLKCVFLTHTEKLTKIAIINQSIILSEGTPHFHNKLFLSDL